MIQCLGDSVYVLRAKKLRFDTVSSLPLADDTHPIDSPAADTSERQGTLTASEAG
jgi:hypothetical protein